MVRTKRSQKRNDRQIMESMIAGDQSHMFKKNRKMFITDWLNTKEHLVSEMK